MDELTLQIPGLTLAGLRFGSRRGRRVLALHGWLDNAASFRGLAPFLGGLDLVAVDLPGHGLSQHRDASAHYHFVNWVADVHAILDALEWDRCHLLGHSMGAGIASLYTGAVPDRVERAVLIEGLGPFTTTPEDAPANLEKALQASNRFFEREARVYPSVEECVERKLEADPTLTRDAARTLVERGTRPVDGGIAFSHDPRLVGRSLLRFTEEHVLALLRRIEAPVRLIRASEGLDYDEPGVMEARVDGIADVDVVTVDGPHHVHLIAPDTLADLVDEFL